MISVRRNHDLQFNYFNNIFSWESLWKKPIQSQNMAKWFLSFNHSYAKAHLIFQQNRDELVKMRLQEGRGVGADGGGCGVREKPRFCWSPKTTLGPWLRKWESWKDWPTFDPRKLILVSSERVVREEVNAAVNMEHTQIPTKIQRTANRRPPTDRG